MSSSVKYTRLLFEISSSGKWAVWVVGWAVSYMVGGPKIILSSPGAGGTIPFHFPFPGAWQLTGPGIPLDLIPPPSSRSGGNEETSKIPRTCCLIVACVTLLPWIRQIQFWTLCSDIPPSPRRCVCVSGSDIARCLNYPQSQILTKLSIIGQNAKLPPARPMIINNCQFLGQNVKFIN